MKTQTFTITTLSIAELRDLLRAPMAACGYDVDCLYFPSRFSGKTLKVESTYDLDAPCDDTLEDVIKENRPSEDGEVHPSDLELYLSMLTCTTLYGDKAIPKTDYMIEEG